MNVLKGLTCFAGMLLSSCSDDHAEMHTTSSSLEDSATVLFSNTVKGHRLSFGTSHHQFYICDSASPMRTGVASFWTEEAYQNQLATEEGVVGVGIASYGPVNCEVVICPVAPSLQFLKQADRIVEGDLTIGSGVLQLSNCPEGTVVYSKRVIPGDYRIRVSAFDINTVRDDKGKDYYLIEIWPDAPKGVIVKKYRKTLS